MIVCVDHRITCREVDFLLLPCGSQRLNSGHQTGGKCLNILRYLASPFLKSYVLVCLSYKDVQLGNPDNRENMLVYY